MIERLTLDTNLIRDHWREHPRKWAIERLLELAAAGSVDLAVTSHIRDDVPNPGPLRDRLAELPAMKVRDTGGVFRFGFSRLGGSDGFGSQTFLACEQLLAAGWTPSRGSVPDKRDWLHLHAHHIQRRDRFLTWDAALIELGLLLEPTFHLGVMRPDDYLRARSEEPTAAR